MLYGGTAIALRLGHRISVDFDFFCERPLDRERLWAVFPFLARSLVLQDRPDTLCVAVPVDDGELEQVKLSFFSGIGFGRVGQPQITDDGVLEVASTNDLLATKLKVILQRIEARDYRDIAALIVAGTNLSQGLAAAHALYGGAFQPSEALKALVYFDGGDLQILTAAEKRCLVNAASAVRELPDVDILSWQLSASSST